MKMIKFLLAAVLMSAVSLSVRGQDEPNLETILASFDARKPCVVLNYDVTYRLLGLQLLKVAVAEARTTEGLWRNSATGEDQDVCLIDLSIKSPGETDEERRDRRIYIDNRIISVVTMPEMNTLFYMKQTREVINPFFKKPVTNDNVHYYDLQSGELNFYAVDHVKNQVYTNLTGATDFASQGREVSTILQMMSDIYHGRRPLLTPEDRFRISVNMDGEPTPFTAETERDEIDVQLDDKRWETLRVDIVPAPEAGKIRKRQFTMWVTSLQDVAERAQNPVLTRLADEAPAWGMAPLVGVIGLPLGHIRCELLSLQVAGAFFAEP